MSSENEASGEREHLSRRQALGYGGAAAATVAAASVLTSPPAAATGYGGDSVTMRSVSLAQARGVGGGRAAPTPRSA